MGDVPNPLPPTAVILGFITGMWAAQAVATVARLGIPDKLAHGPRSVSELANAVGASPSTLNRLLRGVASVGVLRADAHGCFSLTPVGERLRSDVSESMRSWLIAETAPDHWLPWGKLEDRVRRDKSSFESALSTPVWDRKNSQEQQYFVEAMSGGTTMAIQTVLTSYSFAGARKVIDIGGAHGAFLAAVLQRERPATGVLFDLADVITGAGPTLDTVGVADRVECVSGSFFDIVPAGGDVYLLKLVLHEWSDHECVKILHNVREAMSHGGRVIVVEILIADDGPPSAASLLDLDMLVMHAGKERTAKEYGALFARAGLKLTNVISTPSVYTVLEARAA
jgi:hypothetical protein